MERDTHKTIITLIYLDDIVLDLVKLFSYFSNICLVCSEYYVQSTKPVLSWLKK